MSFPAKLDKLGREIIPEESDVVSLDFSYPSLHEQLVAFKRSGVVHPSYNHNQPVDDEDFVDESDLSVEDLDVFPVPEPKVVEVFTPTQPAVALSNAELELNNGAVSAPPSALP
ncbi:MAG: hypothetical protein [Microvirus sp.]|nr:MAG: hypothetical protein [Microvirus sp.]